MRSIKINNFIMDNFLKERKLSKEHINISVNDMNLKGLIILKIEYFTDEEISKILEIDTGALKSETDLQHKRNTSDSKKINAFLLDRTNFILKLLRLSREKLSNTKEPTLAKGLQW